MTKKDYIALADALRRAKPPNTEEPPPKDTAMRVAWNQWRTDVLHIHNVLAKDNPRFDRSRFLAACGSPD